MRNLAWIVVAIASFGCAHPRWSNDPYSDAVRRDALLFYSIHVLELIDAGALEHARDRIEKMDRRFGTTSPEPFMADLLRRRLRSVNGAVLRDRAPLIDPMISVSLGVDPKAARDCHRRARVALEAGDLGLARRELEEACRLDPTFQAAAIDLSKCLKEDGLALYGRGKVDAAVVLWKRALQLVPGDGETQQFLDRARVVKEQD